MIFGGAIHHGHGVVIPERRDDLFHLVLVQNEVIEDLLGMGFFLFADQC
jgi:hypothetical protein